MSVEGNNKILEHIDFFSQCSFIEQDFSGYSSALRYVCKKDDKKYFVKIYENNILKNINYIENIYNKLQIPTMNIIEKDYLSEINKTYVIYEYIVGKTLLELTQKLETKELEEVGKRVGSYLSRFKSIKSHKEEVINLCELEFSSLVEKLYYMKKYYNRTELDSLEFIDLDRLCNIFSEYKKYIYNIEPSFIHKDINLGNIIVHNNDIYFIDTSGGKISFRSLDFRSTSWWTWDGENKLREQAVYRGIFMGLFDGNIPDEFHKELAFTIIYEFLLKIEEASRNNDMKRIKYIFSKFGTIFNQTNYFENYKFDWF